MGFSQLLDFLGGAWMERKHTVSLCMIVKNEESCLRRCLDSLTGIVDEIIIVDTGSTDKTVEIAKEFDAIIKPYQWKNDFADARNYALSFATKDWILVLDADEYLRQSDRDLLISSLNDVSNDCYFIKTLNFTTSANDENYMVNLNQRIFKNHKGFKYIGSIHEQVQYFGNEANRLPNKIIDVGFYHTGYLRETVELKNKPQRNIEILTEILEKEPENSFHKFNLANEMYQLQKYDEAIKLYDEAYYSSNSSQGFMPKLIVFRINAFMAHQDFKKALEAVNEGIKIYPTYTHLMFLKATLEEESGLITKAIDSYEACLKLGKPSPEFEFSENSHGPWPHLKLAALYEKYQDYEKAIQHYNEFLGFDGRQYQVLYQIATCLKKLGFKEEMMVTQLEKYIKPNSINHLILLADLLLKQSYFEMASRYLQSPTNQTNSQLIYLYAKQQFYLGNYEESIKTFKEYLIYDKFETIAHYFYLMYLVTNNEALSLEKMDYPNSIKNLHHAYQQEDASKLTEVDMNMLILLIEESLITEQDEVRIQLATIEKLTYYHPLTIRLAATYLKYGKKEEAEALMVKIITQEQKLEKDTLYLLNQLIINRIDM